MGLMGFTHYSADVSGATPVQIGNGPLTLAALSVSWDAPSTTTLCWVTLYDSLAAPTLGAAFLFPPVPIVTSAPGILEVPIPSTIGISVLRGLWYAVTTTPTGSVAGNTAAAQLWVAADYQDYE